MDTVEVTYAMRSIAPEMSGGLLLLLFISYVLTYMTVLAEQSNARVAYLSIAELRDPNR